MTDDDTVVVMELQDYLSGPEEMRRRELVWGVVREPPAPRYGHQSVVTRATVLLDAYVRQHRVGVVCVSPADVILDAEKALVVQPDVFFITNERLPIVRDQIWGPPDLVVEVLSRGTARYDATTKVGWYRTYGVRECWLLDPGDRIVTVIILQDGADDMTHSFSGDETVRSAVFPEFMTSAEEFFS